MAALEDLLKIDGVAGAFEYAPDGKLVHCISNTDVSPELAERYVGYCDTVMRLMNTGDCPLLYSGQTGAACPDGCSCARSDWIVVVGPHEGVIAVEAGSNLNELIDAVSK